MKKFLTESDKKKIISEKEKMIIESFAKIFNKIKRIDENKVNETWEENKIDWDRAADRYYHNPHDDYQPSDKLTSVKKYDYDMDNYPNYYFETESGTGEVSSLDILRKLAGWEFTSGCESKNPSIIKICAELQNKMDDYYNSFPVVKASYGDSISKEDWKKYNDYIKEVYTHDIVTKIIETELNMSLADAIQKLLDKNLIDNYEEKERGFREPDDYINEIDDDFEKDSREGEYGINPYKNEDDIFVTNYEEVDGQTILVQTSDKNVEEYYYVSDETEGTSEMDATTYITFRNENNSRELIAKTYFTPGGAVSFDSLDFIKVKNI